MYRMAQYFFIQPSSLGHACCLITCLTGLFGLSVDQFARRGRYVLIRRDTHAHMFYSLSKLC